MVGLLIKKSTEYNVEIEDHCLFEITFQRLHPDAEENNEDPQLGSPIFGLTFNCGTFRMK
jgi:hypothetical protein